MTRPAGARGETLRDAIPVAYRVALMDQHPNTYQAQGQRTCPTCGQAMPCLTAMLLEKIHDLEDWGLRLSALIDGCAECSAWRDSEGDL